MFIKLWTGLRDLYQDNKTTASIDNAKRFINWSILDIANEYDWEFLRNTRTLTPTANTEYDLNSITPITSVSANIYAVASAAADDGIIVNMYGSKVSEAVSSNPTITYDDVEFTVSAGISASSSGWSDIQYLYKPVTTGSIFITNGTTTLCTLAASDTYVANDVSKILKIADAVAFNTVDPLDWPTQLEGNPSGTTGGANSGYDYLGGSKIRFFNKSGNAYTILYKKRPKWLVNNWDRTEFPEEFYQDIIDYAYRIYGKQYQDEATAINDGSITELKKILIGNIINKWVRGVDKMPRILPRNYVRSF